MKPDMQLELAIERGERAHDLDLHGASLVEVRLARLSADRLDCCTADLRRSELRAARLGECRFEEARLGDVDWSTATLRACVFDGAHAAHARFDAARLEDSSAKGADFDGASFRDAHLSETSFERAVLHNAVLDGASGDGIVFRGADLSGASLAGVQFEDADFRGANLQGANLSGGSFRHADFRGALLESANLEGADFTGASFDEGEGPRPTEPKTSAKPADASFDAFVAALQGLAGQLETGATLPPLLSGLMRKAGVTPGESAPEQAAMLRRLLDYLREVSTHGDRPEALVKDCRALLDSVLPQLADTVQEADWQALSKLLSSLKDAEAASRTSVD